MLLGARLVGRGVKLVGARLVGTGLLGTELVGTKLVGMTVSHYLRYVVLLVFSVDSMIIGSWDLEGRLVLLFFDNSVEGHLLEDMIPGGIFDGRVRDARDDYGP